MGRWAGCAFVAGAAGVQVLPGLPHFLVSLFGLIGVLIAVWAFWRTGDWRARRPWLNRLAWPVLALCVGAGLAMLRGDVRLRDALAPALENQALSLTWRVAGIATVSDRSQRFEVDIINPPAGVPSRLLLSWFAPGRSSRPDRAVMVGHVEHVARGNPSAHADQAGREGRSDRAGHVQSQEFTPVVPGEIWRGRLALKQPHGLLNPHGFDYEGHLFQNGIRATGSVRGAPSRLGDDPYASVDIAVQRVRHRLREALAPSLKEARYGGVILALAMGDQAAIRKEDWRTFSQTGITHLVSISGLHVTMMAALGGALALLVWSRLSWRGIMLAERTPAQVMGATVALAVAWAYCLIAGWGIPAQRTFFMLAVVALAAIARLQLGGPRVLVLAAVVVTALDPWAPMAAGFWLSFGAVAVLMLAGSGRWVRKPTVTPAAVPAFRPKPSCTSMGSAGAVARPSFWSSGLWGRLNLWGCWAWLSMRLRSGWMASLTRRIREGARLQAALTIGLLPFLALMFQQVSLASPVANAFAIPIVSLVVTPLALAAMFVAMVPGLEAGGHLLAIAAHEVFAWVMWPVQALAEMPYASASTAAAPWPWVAVGVVGVVWSLQPHGLPRRWLGLVLILPVLCYRPARPEPGDWRLTALDVGQGGAVVLETATQTLVFDTGPPFGDASDAGERVVWPYLRARGVTRVDHLVVSHGDADHAGGLVSLLAAVPVVALTASYDVKTETAWPLRMPRLPEALRTGPCEAGQAWRVDDVGFRMLYPADGRRTESGDTDKADARPDGRSGNSASASRNARSCVLHVQGRHHAALLPGDIGSAQESAILAEAGVESVRADVALMAHHGSRHSSGASWTAAVGARHAVAQAGYLNSYRHPHPDAVTRWKAAAAAVHRTDRDGAIILTSSNGELNVTQERDRQRRYWHSR